MERIRRRFGEWTQIKVSFQIWNQYRLGSLRWGLVARYAILERKASTAMLRSLDLVSTPLLLLDVASEDPPACILYCNRNWSFDTGSILTPALCPLSPLFFLLCASAQCCHAPEHVRACVPSRTAVLPGVVFPFAIPHPNRPGSCMTASVPKPAPEWIV